MRNPSSQETSEKIRAWKARKAEYMRTYRNRPEWRAQKAEYMRRYNEKHPEQKKAADKRWGEYGKEQKRIRRDYIDNFKSKPCTDCGLKYAPYVMDLDHREPAKKEFNVSKMASWNMPIELINEELQKCDVVCANCHRERTHKQQLSGVI